MANDPDYYDLLPLVDLTAAVPRVHPRTITDMVSGYELRASDDALRWKASVHVTNLTNKTAMYNFQSIFVGTRLVAPRVMGLRLRWYW